MIRIFDINWMSDPGALFYTIKGPGNSVVTARTSAGIYRDPPDAWIYAVDVDLSPTQVGRLIWDNGTEYYSETFDMNMGAAGTVVAGEGAYEINLEFKNEAGSVLPGAKVRVTNNVQPWATSTNGDGRASFSLDSGTYRVTATLAGFEFPPTTLVVTGSSTIPYTMTSTVTLPQDIEDNMTIGLLVTRNGQGKRRGGVPIVFQLINPSADSDSFDMTPFTISSSAITAVLQVPLRKNSDYKAKTVGGTSWVPFTTGTDEVYRIPEILGTYQ